MKILSYLIAGACCLLMFDSCQNSGTSPTTPGGSGKSGSLARFALTDHYLYTVDQTTLRLFDVSQGGAKFITSVPIGFSIETIFARGNTLFLGASDGVHIYDITVRQSPKHLSTYRHITSCDPVVADEQYAYSTLSTGWTTCWRGMNVLDIIDVSDLRSPLRVSSMLLTNPIGLGLTSANRLVVCDNGLKLLNVTDRKKPELLHAISAEKPFDIIPYNDRFIAVIPGGLVNYTVANDSLQLVGKLSYR